MIGTARPITAYIARALPYKHPEEWASWIGLSLHMLPENHSTTSQAIGPAILIIAHIARALPHQTTQDWAIYLHC